MTRAASARNVSTARSALHFFVAEPASQPLEIGGFSGSSETPRLWISRSRSSTVRRKSYASRSSL